MSSKYKKYKLGEKYIVIDKGFTLAVYDHNVEVHLFPQSKKILRLLIEAKMQGQDISKEDIYACLWDSEGALQKSCDETIRGCIRKLRAELGHDMIRTIYGAGYSLNESIVELKNEDDVENKMWVQRLPTKETYNQPSQEYSCSGELESAFVQLDMLYSQLSTLAEAVEKLGSEIYEYSLTIPSSFRQSGKRLLDDFVYFDRTFDHEGKEYIEKVNKAFEQRNVIVTYSLDNENFLEAVFNDVAMLHDELFKWICVKETKRQELESRHKYIKEHIESDDDIYSDPFFNV